MYLEAVTMEIQEEVDRRGETSYRARKVAARGDPARRNGMSRWSDLMVRWRAELEGLGWSVERSGPVDRGGAAGRFVLAGVDARRGVRRRVGQDGALARQKIVARKEVVVEVAPHLFGQEREMLDRLVDRVIADPEMVPRIRVPGAREQVWSLASVLARETAIVAQRRSGDGPLGRPVVSVGPSLAAAEARMGYRLDAAQRAAAEAICTSGRGAELVIGVAGSGKSTMLAVVTDAFETAGCQVLGTATSGQAARNLGDAAEIDESRTIASLVWRLDHDRLRLDRRTVLVLDEAGMTDDPDFLRLALRVEGAGAKMVIVGDNRQLGSVGPGGAMGALLPRHPEAVHMLAITTARSTWRRGPPSSSCGPGRWVSPWTGTHEHGRITPSWDRDEALDRAVEGWAADVEAGRDAGLYAYQRSTWPG